VDVVLVGRMHCDLGCSSVDEQRWGSITRLTLPGGGRLGVWLTSG